MKAFIIRNGSIALGLLIGGFIMLLCLPLLRDDRGAPAASLLQAQSIAAALPVMLLCFAGVTVIAAIVTRLVNACVGWFVLGGCIYVLDYRLSNIDQVLLSGSLGWNVIELFLWFIIALGAALVVLKFGGPLDDVHRDEDGRSPSPLFSIEALKSAAAGALLLPVVWFLTVNELKGQAFGCVFVGALAAGLGGRLLSPHVQPVLLFASPLFFAAVGSLIAVIMTKQTQEELFELGTLAPVLRITPIDYLAGSMMGVAVGFGWARSFLHHEDDEHAHQPARATAR